MTIYNFLLAYRGHTFAIDSTYLMAILFHLLCLESLNEIKGRIFQEETFPHCFDVRFLFSSFAARLRDISLNELDERHSKTFPESSAPNIHRSCLNKIRKWFEEMRNEFSSTSMCFHLSSTLWHRMRPRSEYLMIMKLLNDTSSLSK